MDKSSITFKETLTLMWWTLFNGKNSRAFHRAMRNGANEREAFDYANKFSIQSNLLKSENCTFGNLFRHSKTNKIGQNE